MVDINIVVVHFSFYRHLAKPRYQRVMGLYGWEILMVSHHPAKFGGHGHCCNSGDITLSVVEDQDFLPCLNPSLLLISKAHGMRVYGMAW